jgi:hypothetical protein
MKELFGSEVRDQLSTTGHMHHRGCRRCSTGLGKENLEVAFMLIPKKEESNCISLI